MHTWDSLTGEVDDDKLVGGSNLAPAIDYVYLDGSTQPHTGLNVLGPLHQESDGSNSLFPVTETTKRVSSRTRALYDQLLGQNEYITSSCNSRTSSSERTDDLQTLKPELQAWCLVFERLDGPTLCALSRVSKGISNLAINFLYRNITLFPRSLEECDYEDLACVLRKLNGFESLRRISRFTKSFTIGPGWYLLPRQHSYTICHIPTSFGTQELLLAELSVLIGSVVKNIRQLGLESFILESPIPLSPYVFSNLAHNNLILKRLHLNVHPKAVLPGPNSIRDPFLTPYRHAHKPFLELRPVNLLKLNLYHASSAPDEIWWNMLHNMLAACAPTLRHLSLEFPHFDSFHPDHDNGYKPDIPSLRPLPTLSQSEFIGSPQNAGDHFLTLWSLHLAGIHIDSNFIHWTFPSPSPPPTPPLSPRDNAQPRVLHLMGCSMNKYKVPRGHECGPSVVVTESFSVLRAFITRASAQHLQKLELRYPVSSQPRAKDGSMLNNILMSVPQLAVLKLSQGIKASDRALRKLFNPRSKLEMVELEVSSKQWRLFMGLLRQTEGLKRVVVLGPKVGGLVPVRSGNGLRARGLADDAEELATAVVSNKMLRIVGREDFLWKVLGEEDGVRIKRVKE